MKAVFVTAITLVSVAFAQIGEPVSSLVTRLAPNLLSETATGYVSGGGFSFSPEERSGIVYSVSAEGTLDEANIAFAADLVGAVTGYGEQIAAPVREYFTSSLGDLAGQGPTNLSVQQYAMAIEVSGETAPYDARFTLTLPEIAAQAFPEAKHTLGPADATYVVREFSDFQCPYCARFSSTAMPLIKDNLLARGDVRFEFHHFPLQTIHANALSAAEAAECVTAANTPEAFWTYHDALFERQQAWQALGDPNAYYVRLAQDIGLETEGVESCLAERVFADEINAASQAAGGGLGLRSTPSVFVNGYRVGDYTELSSYLALIDMVEKFAQSE